ncbi:hypothetical protein VNO78_01391 [Psophocarpus tetragonolobus]|uniref:Uncharacterized protein n=1 Tax=Psophocarpus tetragonolobus TaxID=3891 RepID=A0AAN9SXX6_PSOTE
MGTWLACSKQGRVAFLTNVLELHTLPEVKSRGDLPVLFLKSRKQPKEFAESLKSEAHYYNGFNLIVADIKSKSMVYISNRPKGQPITIQEVPSGLHVLSNDSLDSPWHKVLRLELSFKEHVGKYGEGEIPVRQGLYGTRSSAALTVRSSGKASFYELYLDDTKWKEHVIDFHIGNLNYTCKDYINYEAILTDEVARQK